MTPPPRPATALPDVGPSDAGAARLRAALDDARLGLHLQILPSAVGSTALLAAALGILLWPAVGLPLLGWALLLALALGARVLIGQAQRRAAARGPLDARRWLRRHRGAYLGHGLAWAVLVFGTGWQLPHGKLDLLTLGLVALVGGSLVAGAYDRRAAMAFALPAGLPLLLRLLGAGAPPEYGHALLSVMFFTMMAIIARRTEVAMAGSLRAEHAAAERAREAERARTALAEQHRVIGQLLEGTSQGYWRLDAQGLTVDVNPAMCELLGRRRDLLVGRPARQFFDGESLARLERELAARRDGARGIYEIDITRPDGTRVHCHNSATPLFDGEGRHIGSVGLWTDLSARHAAELELRIHALAMQSITDLVSVIDADWRYLDVNQAWSQAVGVDAQTARGRRIDELLGASFPEPRRVALERCFAERRIQRLRAPIDTAPAGGRVFETTYYPYLGSTDRVQWVVMVSRDITADERLLAALKASEAALRDVLDTFPGFIVAIDEQARYAYVNERIAALMGRPADDWLGRHPSEIFGAERWQVLEPEMMRALAGERLVVERHFPATASRPAVDMEITHVVGRRPDGSRLVYAFGVDITARKRAGAELVAARDEAERANRAKSQFLAQMSHELRTPLNAVLGFAQLLQADAGPRLLERERGQLREIIVGGRHLLELINEMLDLGRIEAGQLVVEEVAVPLAPLIEESLGLVRGLASERGRRLLPGPQVPPTAAVRGDRMRVKQVLLNLLANAVKYNREGGEIEVTCSPALTCPGGWRITVRDGGRGLRADEQSRLFQPFERLGAAAAGIEGTGIGLALSRRLLEAMGGAIGVDSEPGVGSRFWFELAGAESTGSVAPARAVTADDTLPLPSRRVLYIEDNPVNVVLMEAMLARLPGLEVVSAAHPAEGLRMAQREPPALVLLDIQMPGMDGFEVFARLRADERTRALPVVAVSADGLASNIDAALAAGFAAYLTKPLELGLLLDTVRRLLREPAAASAPH